jgi:hypothetical protein
VNHPEHNGHEAKKMVATLTGLFGIQHPALAEDGIQKARTLALQTGSGRSAVNGNF